MQITIRHGSIYLTDKVYRCYFDGLESVILMRKANDLAILPVRHAAAGGYLLKLKNSAGDRVVNAMDFLASNGIDQAEAMNFDVDWSSDLSSLMARNVFETA